MNIKDILLIIIIIYLIISHKKNNNIEKFAVTDDIRAAVKEIYNTDMQAVRNLDKIAKDLQTGALTIPGNLSIPGNLIVTGTITGTKTIDGSITGNAATADSASKATSAGSATSATSATSAEYVTSGIKNGTSYVLYNSSGNIGIGTGTEPPLTKFHVKNGAVYLDTGGGYIDRDYASKAGWMNRNVVALFEGGWVASGSGGFIQYSDERIKTNIINIDINNNLKLFRKIRPVKYGYIDKLEYGNIIKYGFIAQEIQEILPEAIVEKTQIIPSIYSNAIIKNKSILSFDKPILKLEQFNNGIKLKCYDIKNEIVWVTIKEIIDSQNIEIEENIENDELFIYGHSVDDFLQIEKDTIWTVTTCAVQEIDRQQQIDKEQLNDLKNKESKLEAKVVELEEKVVELEKKILRIESMFY